VHSNSFVFIATLLDMIVVESYYRSTDAWDSIWLWHSIYLVLYLGIPILMSLKLRSFIPLSIIIAFAFGIEDTTFYALQSRLPAQYIGVEILSVWEPSLATALAFNLLGLILICLFLVTVSTFEHRHQSIRH
jgi:hypothetical protein